MAIVGPDGHRTTLTVDDNGYLASVTDPSGNIWSMTYDEEGLLKTFIEPTGNASGNPGQFTHTYKYEPDGRLQQDSDPLDGFKSLERFEENGAYTVALSTATGQETSYRVESVPTGGRKRINTAPAGEQSTQLITDADVSSTSPDGTNVHTTQGPDPRWGMMVPVPTDAKTTLPSGLVRQVATTRTASLVDPNDPLSHTHLAETTTINSTRTTVRQFARPIGPDGDPTTPRGGIWTTTTPTSRVTITEINVHAQPIRTQVADLHPWFMDYDERGRLQSLATGAVDDEDDPLPDSARVTTLAYHVCADGSDTCTEEDAGGGMKGYLASVTDAAGRTSSFEQDAAGRVLLARLPGDREVAFSYDPNGNLLSLAPPERPAHRFTYTPVDLVASYIPPVIPGDPALDEPDEVQTLYTYDLDRLLTRVEYPDGDSVDYDYLFGDHLTDATTHDGIHLHWDYLGDEEGEAKTGQLQAIEREGDTGESSASQTLRYEWDGFLPLSEEWGGPVSGKVSLAWDNNFWVTSQTVAGTAPVTFAYDNDGLLTRAGAMTLTRSATNGLVTTASLAGVGASPPPPIVTDYTWSAFGELSGMTTTRDGRPYLALTYERDLLGRIVTKTESVEGGTPVVWTYTYDLAGRLAGVERDGELVESYAYDGNGNRTEVEVTLGDEVSLGAGDIEHDEQDRLLRYGDELFTYTANGEMRTRTGPDGTTTYDYDAFGNLRRVDLPDFTAIEYLVDGRNRRVGRVRYDASGAETDREGYLYGNQLNIVALLDDEGAIVYRFVYGTAPHVPDYAVNADGAKVYRIVTDHLGSVRLVVDVGTGDVVEEREYDSYGVVLRDEGDGGGVRLPFGFAGGLGDAHSFSGIGSRDYLSQVGRWMTVDRIRFASGDSNLYEYVHSNPSNLIDPSGKFGVVGCIGGMVGAASFGVMGGAMGTAAGAAAAAAMGQCMAHDDFEAAMNMNMTIAIVAGAVAGCGVGFFAGPVGFYAGVEAAAGTSAAWSVLGTVVANAVWSTATSAPEAAQ